MRLRTATAALIVLCAAVAHAAPNKKECLSASDDGQDLRAQGKLLAARDRFAVCAHDACPAVLRKDCVKWLNEVQESMPTVVLGARDDRGDLLDVVVTLDGAPLTAKLDGKAIAIDPGPHKFTFEIAGRPPVDVQVLLTEGDKNRRVQAVFPATEVRPSEPPPSALPPKQPSYVAPIVFGAIGVAAIGAFAYLGVTGARDIKSYRDTCSPRCDPDDVDAAKRKLLFADISLGVGVIALSVSTYLFLDARASTVNVALSPRGALATWTASF